MGLGQYKKMREFGVTPEPEGKVEPRKGELRFVVQKHDASHLHYDFRLEMEGVLKSWAVPKGPSLDPKDKRLAMMTEDHPMSYRTFEGVIPEGNYGAGEVIVWDIGTYAPLESSKDGEKELLNGLKKGSLKFKLKGKKLRGAFALVKIKNKDEGKDNAWLLIKEKDAEAGKRDVTEDVGSVLSSKVLSRDGGRSFNSKKREKAISKKPKKRGDAPLPRDVRPMLATLVDAPFDREDWIFEIKYDGYRAMARVEEGKVELYSRNSISFNSKYPEIVQTLSTLPHNVLLDGEVVAVDENGLARFQYLQHYGEKRRGTLLYYIFDILHLDGEDLADKTLLERKEILRMVIPEDSILRYSEHVLNKGKDFFKVAEEAGLEGVMAKDGQSLYEPGARSRSWLKVKTEKRQEAVIVGFTEPRGSRKKFGALVLGVYKDGKLTYIGHTGTGFNEKSIAGLYSEMKPLISNRMPFDKKPVTNMPVTWLTPKLVAEIKFTEWTEGGSMRHPVFVGLREDKSAKEVIMEEEVPSSKPVSRAKRKNAKSEVSELKLTHLDKVFWPKEGITKGDLIEYYRKVSKVILPHLKDRPQSLNRHPDGIEGGSFYQKNIRTAVPSFAQAIKIRSESEDREIKWLLCQNEETLLYMANLGCIEINPWNSRYTTPDNPDYLIIDLDPDDPNPFEEVVKTALIARKILEDADIRNYIKTSGKTGMHIVIPLKAKYAQAEARLFGEILANLIHSKFPEKTSVLRSPAKRRGKIYVDFLQNRSGQTIAAPYSVRPWPGATVSTPLKWEEVTKKLHPSKFTIKNTIQRIEKVGDLWCPVIDKGIDLEKALRNLQK